MPPTNEVSDNPTRISPLTQGGDQLRWCIAVNNGVWARREPEVHLWIWC